MDTPRYPAFDQFLRQAEPGSWRDEAIPLEARGVRRQWACDFIRHLLRDINAARAVPPFYFLNCHGLVQEIVKPLTAALRAPLYALVPEEHRGRPTTFVSHTWSSLLVGPDQQRIG